MAAVWPGRAAAADRVRRRAGSAPMKSCGIVSWRYAQDPVRLCTTGDRVHQTCQKDNVRGPASLETRKTSRSDNFPLEASAIRFNYREKGARTHTHTPAGGETPRLPSPSLSASLCF